MSAYHIHHCIACISIFLLTFSSWASEYLSLPPFFLYLILTKKNLLLFLFLSQHGNLLIPSYILSLFYNNIFTNFLSVFLCCFSLIALSFSSHSPQQFHIFYLQRMRTIKNRQSNFRSDCAKFEFKSTFYLMYRYFKISVVD